MKITSLLLLAPALADSHEPPPASASLSVRDLRRAHIARPADDSHVHGATAAEAFAKMNDYLAATDIETAPCDEFDHAALNDVARVLHAVRVPEMHQIYKANVDRRALHFDTLGYKEALWAAEADELAAGSRAYNVTRDGKCAEVIMWYVHHLSEGARAELAAAGAFALPLMPADAAPEPERTEEYDQQIGCTSCHVAVHIPGTPDITPIPFKNSTDPQYPETCPIDEATGLPTVWYNRTKRCDWDFAPFCSPCEGVGGMIWGSGEHDWLPMPCEPIALPEEIPADNLTSPLWPTSFTVEEYASLTFPGRDPCEVDFKNSTYTLYFETTDEGPIYHTVGHSGPSGPSPFPGSSWALPNGNFFTTVDVAENPVFCTCLGPVDPVVDNAITGPLRYDFNDGAKLVGRERVTPEYFDAAIVADHWVKGPHHFWVDVATNTMVREWQPFNGLQTYYDWTVGTPDADKMALAGVCSGFLTHVNVSCVAPL